MTPHQKRKHSSIAQRMIQDMTIRNYAQNTIDSYSFHVGRFETFLGNTPAEEATPDHVRDFQLYLIEKQRIGYSSFNQAVCSLKLLYSITLPRAWHVSQIPFARRPKKLPVVLGSDEVDRLLACTRNLKHRTLLTLLYATGLRLTEAARLRIADIDSGRMMLHVRSGKGDRDRSVPISPRMLLSLREYWKQYRPEILLFPGKYPDKPYAGTSIQKVVKRSAKQAAIRKSVSPHTLRHSYATGLLEAGVDLLTISRLLGHKSFATTMIYLHVRRPNLMRAPSPVDWLPTRQLPKWRDPDSDNKDLNLPE